MLHLLSLLIVLSNAPASKPCALSGVSPVDFATQAHKSQLRDCLISQTVCVNAPPIKQKYIRVVGLKDRKFGGVKLEGGRLLSVIGATQGYTLSLGYRMPVEVIGVEPKTGVALLRASAQTQPVTRSWDKMAPGRIFFAIDEGRQLHRFAVPSKGDGAFGYYWHAHVRLPMGTPIFNARGQWVTLAALSAGASTTYLLPQEAFEKISFREGEAP